MIMDEDAARAYVSSLGGAEAFQKLKLYVAELTRENEDQNLVARSSLDDVWVRHIADSAQLLEYVPRETGIWLDLGSGAGLPGIIVAIMRPEQQVSLVESRARRIKWLNHLCAELALENCRVIGSRLELVQPFESGVISARAFAPLPRLLDLAAPFSTDRTHWVLPKGRSAAQELAGLPRRWREKFHVEQSRTDPNSGIIVGKPRKAAGNGP